MRVASLCLGLIAAPLATSLQAEERVFAPSSAWNLDYGAESCNLRRTFGEGKDRLSFEMQQAWTAPYFNLLLSGSPLQKTGSRIMSVQFGPDEASSERGFLMGRSDETELPFLLMFGIHLAPVSEAAKRGEFSVVDIGRSREQAITRLTLSKGIKDTIVLELGPMDQPLAALRTCVDDLVQSLGLSDNAQAGLASTAVLANTRQTAQFIQERYPPHLLDNSEDGAVSVKLVVNPKGKATVCQVAKSTRPAVFDDYVCYTMLRVARYEPAMNAQGEAVYSVATQSVRFEVD